MITPILEKLLFKGAAKNKTFTMAYGTHAHLDIPANSFIVIHKVIFYPFINPKDYNPRIPEPPGPIATFPVETWKQFANDIEYQLKIESDKENPFFYQFRNGLDLYFLGNTNSVNLDETIEADFFNKKVLIQPKAPIILDTFITSYDYFNFTLTRNSLKIASTLYAPVNEYANEKNMPTGIANENVLLTADLTGTGTTETYNPATEKEITGYILPADNTVNYQQLYERQTPGNYSSFIADPTRAFFPDSDKTTNPLITFEYCVIQLNAAGNLSSL